MTFDNGILDRVTEYYLASHDFNGTPVSQLEVTDIDALKEILRKLVTEEKIILIFGEIQLNPHIKRLPDLLIDKQLERLCISDLQQVCAYPSPTHLAKVVKVDDYKDTPYTKMLALGKAQLDYCSFDLSVLENYRNDPRYYYKNNDISGQIYVKSIFYESDHMPEQDKILLNSFGFSYDESLKRTVAVFIRYLSDLSPEHQAIWQSKQLNGEYKLHPIYFETSVTGDFANGLSVFQALKRELQELNKLSEIMARPPLFNKDFKEEWPTELCFLIRPTYREFNHFIESLDKVLSDNINKSFFRNEVSYEIEEERNDGRLMVRNKGTITILQDWLSEKYAPRDPVTVTKIISILKNIRELRNKSAHAVLNDEFDQKYLHEQRTIISEVFDAIRSLRVILSTHPDAKDYSPPAFLEKTSIFIN